MGQEVSIQRECQKWLQSTPYRQCNQISWHEDSGGDTSESADEQYCCSGRSTGEADVVFENKADALKAKSQFDNVALDGQAMKIEFIQNQGGERVLASGIRYACLPSPFLSTAAKCILAVQMLNTQKVVAALLPSTLLYTFLNFSLDRYTRAWSGVYAVFIHVSDVQ